MIRHRRLLPVTAVVAATSAAVVAVALASSSRHRPQPLRVPAGPSAEVSPTAVTADTASPGPPTTAPAQAEAVARRFATAVWTVDYRRPYPAEQRRLACRPWDTDRADAQLAHGHYFTAAGTDPRVATSEVDQVQGVDLAVEDEVPGSVGYSAVVTYTAHRTTGDRQATGYLDLRVVATGAGWLVDEARIG